MPTGIYKRKPFTEKTKNKMRISKLALSNSHGMSYTRFHYLWAAMKQRCLYPKNISYKYYGGRGISIHKRWLNFKNFQTDMYDSYISHCKKYGTRLHFTCRFL